MNHQLWKKTVLAICACGLTPKLSTTAAVASPTQSEASSEVQITCKVGHDGYGYDLHLIKGFSDPELIKSALGAVLSAMPFQAPKDMPADRIYAKCSVVSEATKPKVTLQFLDSPANGNIEESGIETVLKQIPHQDKEFKSDSIIRSWMAERLIYLCTSLYDYPESVELRSDLHKTFSGYGLNSTKAHDWLCLARASSPTLIVMRNPGSDVKKECKESVITHFEAWKLSHSRPAFLELNEAYSKLLACDVMTASKAEPCILASAAILSGQYKEAKSQYKLGAEEGDKTSKEILDRQNREAKSSYRQSDLPVKADIMPDGNAQDWKKLLRWFPNDCETLIVVKDRLTGPKEEPPSKPIVITIPMQGDGTKADKKDAQQEFSMPPPAKVDYRVIFEGLVTPEPIREKKDLAKQLKMADVAVSIHAGRNSKFPKGWGTGTQQGAEVVVFKDSGKTACTTLMDKLKSTCDWTQNIEGVEVLAFDPGVYRGPIGPAGRGVAYLCSPCKGVIVNASNLQFLQEMFDQMKNPDLIRAFADDLPEWKKVDTASDWWAIRHYDKSYSPFDSTALEQIASPPGTNTDDWGSKLDKDAIGLTVTKKSDGSPDMQLIPEPKIEKLPDLPPDIAASASKMPAIAPAQLDEMRKGMMTMMMLIKLGYQIAL